MTKIVGSLFGLFFTNSYAVPMNYMSKDKYEIIPALGMMWYNMA
jgi:hypothetical protein